MSVDMNYNIMELDHKMSNGNEAIINQTDNCTLSWRNSNDQYNANIPYEGGNSFNKNEMFDENFLDSDKLRKYSVEEGTVRDGELRKRTLSLMMDRMNGKLLINFAFRRTSKKS